MKKCGLKLLAVCATLTLTTPFFTNVNAVSKYDVTVDGVTFNVEQLAKNNGVDAYQLRKAILEEDGLKASPFSNLPSRKTLRNMNKLANEKQVEKSYVSSSAKKATKSDQDSTAYVAKSGALTASGKTPAVGMCAMHQNVTTKTGTTSKTTVKLGTTIYMNDSVDVNGTTCSSFVVEDRGKPDNRTKYWIDIYFGQYSSKKDSTYKAAINYGIQTVGYYYYY